MVKDKLSVGKLPPEHLADLLQRHTFSLPDDRVLVYPGVGEDAAVIDMGERWLVAKTDPITFATDEIGWYAVHVNANDVATAGGTPRWFLSTLLLPAQDSNIDLVDRIMSQIAQACRDLNVIPCGGHTEVTYGLPRPVLVGTMLGEIESGRLVRSGGVAVGDTIVLTKGVAIEGTAILALEKASDLQNRFSAQFVQRCQAFLRDPGISVVPEACIAMDAVAVHAMHDPTEGGIATGLWELATASQVGLQVDVESIPVFQETQELCQVFGLDPLGLIASGALLIAVAPSDQAALCTALESAGIESAPIACAVPADEGLRISSVHGTQLLPRYDQDEITRVFQ
jgi:hydrogenase maturation factor